MGGGDTNHDRISGYEVVRIGLASPQDIRSWSFGEVKKPETINPRPYRPENDFGLCCERIFGPEKDWECACGKYRGMKYEGMICDRCGVKIAHSRVRRHRMGHIELAAPVMHVWFFRAASVLLGMWQKDLEQVIYNARHIVLDPGRTGLRKQQLLKHEEYRQAREAYGNAFEAGTGAETVKQLLARLNLADDSADLRERVGQELRKVQPVRLAVLLARRRFKVVEALRRSGGKPEWMVLECIPVIPPDLRPLVPLDSGHFAPSDLNYLYRRIIQRNDRIRKLTEHGAVEVVLRCERRNLQHSVDALFDNSRGACRPVLGPSNRPLQSLADMLQSVQRRFPVGQFAKRVDFSGRSVIVPGPDLQLHQCGLPRSMALVLFEPFVLRRLIEMGHADSAQEAGSVLARKGEKVWEALEYATRSHPVLLSRPAAAARTAFQAFEPVLIEGDAIRIHPLVCKGFNADFDGDQMAVHLPLSIEAQVEATVLMTAANNLLNSVNGQLNLLPSLDVVMGCYHLTTTRGEPGDEAEAGEGMTFTGPAEVFTAHALNRLSVHARIHVRLPMGKKVVSELPLGKYASRVGEVARKPNGLVLTTVGRVQFNDILHPKMAFYDMAMSSKQLAKVIFDCYQQLGRRETIELLDRVKQLGFREATRSGLSVAAADLKTPKNKAAVLAAAEKQVERFRRQYEEGNICESERFNTVIDVWTHARDEITKQMMEDLKNDRRDGVPYLNPIFLMAHSGACGGVEQIRQLAGLRGVMAKPNGTIIETPIKANFREGLSVLEYFISTHAAGQERLRKAREAADPAYLTRKLVDAAGNVVVTMHDCGTTRGVTKGAIGRETNIERPLSDSIRGRVSCTTLCDPVSNKVIVGENEMIAREAARTIERMGVDKMLVRSPMTCEAPLGVCRLCYGMDLATGALVEEGTAVGVLAAQAIGEPAPQLPMRTYFIGGPWPERGENAGKAKRAGTVKFERVEIVKNDKDERIALARNGEVLILDWRGRELERYSVPNGAQVMVEDGAEIVAGQVICRWDPHVAPIVADRGGWVRFHDIVAGATLGTERDRMTGVERRVIMEHSGELHSRIVIEDDGGRPVTAFFVPEKTYLEVQDGQRVSAGTLLARTPRDVAGTQDLAGGMPTIINLFEARPPLNPAKMAEVAGVVRLGEKKRGKRTIYIQPVDDAGNKVGEEREHQAPPGKHLRVHTGDRVKEGDRLVFGPLAPQEILKISGIEAVQQYLVQEVQAVYRAQRVEIDDKHIEIIVSQMLRKVQVKAMGDTGLLPGSVIDKFAFRQVNERLRECVKIKDVGDSKFEEGKIVSKEAYEEERARLEAEDKTVPTWVEPSPATNTTQLLGITKAAVQSESFISAASFQETTKVLTEAALAGKVDYLVGLKENVILGHLVPAGTGFHTHQEAEVRLNARALETATTDDEAEEELPAPVETAAATE